MPKYSKLVKKTEHKLDLTKFFGEILEEGEEAYIYIKKLTPVTKRQLQMLSVDNFGDKEGQEMMNKMVEYKDILSDQEAFKNLPQSEQIKMVNELKVMNKGSKMFEYTNQMQRIVLENGVIPDKHNWFNDDGETLVDLDFDTFQSWPDEAIEYIVDEIKNFSEGFSLGKKTEQQLSLL